ncbi:putative C6 transcription factor [Aspergillus varians]
MQASPTKRKRSKVACDPCRSRKRKCNGLSPCSTCGDWGYECHYSRQSTPVTKPSTTTATTAAAAATPKSNDGQHDKNVQRRLEANSGAAFVRSMGVKMDPTDAPRMNLFGWNIGARQLHSDPGATPALSIFQITSPREIKSLAKVYFQKVDPCYGFIDHQVFFQRLEERSQLQSQSPSVNGKYDSVIAGVAALGCLFSRKDVTLTEVHLVQSARSNLELDFQPRPSFDLVTGWLLRVMYMRMTALPYPTWLASCTLMHLIEASGIHHEASSTTLFTTNTPDDQNIKNSLIGVAQHLNLWISFDLGLSRVSFRHEIPLPESSSSSARHNNSNTNPANYTSEIFGLWPASASLDPDQATDDKSLEASFLHLLDRTHTEPPSILAQCNLVLCMLRRLHPVVILATTERILALLQRGLRSARTLAQSCSPWQHVANVPFHTVCSLLVLDTRAAFKLLAEAMRTLRLVASVYSTDTMREACRTAELLIFLHRRRRSDDVNLLDEVLAEGRTDPSDDGGEVAQQQQEHEQPYCSELDQFSWLESLVSGMPSLEGLEFEQFFPQDGEAFGEEVESDFVSQAGL